MPLYCAAIRLKFFNAKYLFIFGKILENGLCDLFCFWLHPLLVGLSGPFVGAFPKIQTRIYRTWPVVHTAPTAKDDNNDALDRHRAPFPLTAKQAMGH